jgi:hypothetical protein
MTTGRFDFCGAYTITIDFKNKKEMDNFVALNCDQTNDPHTTKNFRFIEIVSPI